MISIGHDSVYVFFNGAERFNWFIEGQTFSRSFYFAPRPPPPPPPHSFPISNLDRRHTGRLRKRDNLLKGEGGRGWARSRIIRPQESLVLYKSFNTLWGGGDVVWLECDCVCMRMFFIFKSASTCTNLGCAVHFCLKQNKAKKAKFFSRRCEKSFFILFAWKQNTSNMKKMKAKWTNRSETKIKGEAKWKIGEVKKAK